MKLRPLFSFSFLLLLSWLALSCQSNVAQSDAKQHLPTNVVLILTDDQGYGDVSLHGNDSIHTPNQDKLGREGIRLDNFFVSPVCAPTRASLLTGRYHYRTGTSFVTRNLETMRSEEVTLAEVFKDNGYQTGCFGKWHNGSHYPENPNGQGFDTFVGFCGGHWNRYIDPVLEVNGEMLPTKGYIADIVTDSALTFIEKNKSQPFFTYIPYNTPHTPFISPPALYEKYKSDGRSDQIASTYGMVENIDNNIGRILNKLDHLQILDNTLIIFLTDNGPNFNRYNAGMKGRKGWINDGGVRVPCFFYWKDHFQGNRIINSLTSHIDILPTLVDLLNLKPTKTLPLDGISFAPILENAEAALPERDLFTFSMNQEKYKGSIRTPTYRLTITDKETYQLTYLKDAKEEDNITEQFPDVARSLYQKYLDKYGEVTQGLEDFVSIPVGFQESPLIELPAHEGFFTGDIRYATAHWGWCNDWFTNWKNPSDTMYWHIDVVQQGKYRVKLQYSAPEVASGIPISVMSQDNQLEGTISKPFVSTVIKNHEQVARDVEAEDMTWAIQDLGNIQLEEGAQKLHLFSKQITSKNNIDLKALYLELISGE